MVVLVLTGNVLVMRELIVGGVVETYWCYQCQSMAV
jgi:hypothetical protein